MEKEQKNSEEFKIQNAPFAEERETGQVAFSSNVVFIRFFFLDRAGRGGGFLLTTAKEKVKKKCTGE